jgi:K+-transporting ATPase A subunit
MIKKMLPPMRLKTSLSLLLPALALLLATTNALGQAAANAQPPVEMADTLRADGKIWVVVGVMTIVTLGVLTYLIRLDGKVSALEKRLRQGR